MTNNLNLSVPESTANKPCRFFFEMPLITHSFIQDAKLLFFPSDYEMATTSDKIIWVDQVKEIVEIEYQVEVDWSEEYGPTLEWRTKKYYFKKSLALFLRRQFNQSISLFEEKFESIATGHKQEYYVKNIVIQIAAGYRALSLNPTFASYLRECQGPFIGLMHYLYTNFPAYTPPRTAEIDEILAKSFNADFLPDVNSLSPKLAKSIIDLNYRGEKIFSFTDPDVENKLKHFIKGQLERITLPIVFDKHPDATRYFIHQIAVLVNIRLTDIERKNIFLYKGNPLTASEIYSSASKFKSRNTPKKNAIDNVIEMSLI